VSGFAQQLGRLRRSVGLIRMDDLAKVAVRGEHAYDLLDAALPCAMHLLDGQARQTLLLREDATVAADVLLVCEDDHYLLLADGVSSGQLLETLSGHRQRGWEVELESLEQSHALIQLSGPWAWELLADFDTPGIAGMRYLAAARIDSGLCIRAGHTGEYGYDLLVPHSQASTVWDRLIELGARMDAGAVGREALAYAALQDWFFDMGDLGPLGLTPLELQLQWRLCRHKRYPGSETLRQQREHGLAKRITAFRSGLPLQPGQIVSCEGRGIGEIVVVKTELAGQGCFGLALLDLPWAQAGMVDFSVLGGAGPVELRTISPPFVTNLSLFVRAQQDPWDLRHTLEARVAPGWAPLAVGPVAVPS